MMPFHQALKKFSETGLFELKDTRIFLEHIQRLKKRVAQLKELKPEISFYQIHLSQITLMPGAAPKAVRPKQVLSGLIIEHPSRSWQDELTDVTIAQMIAPREYYAPLNVSLPEEQNAELKRTLYALLMQPNTWDSIKLDRVFFQENQSHPNMNQHFIHRLLTWWAQDDTLKELAIKPLSLLANRTALIGVLVKNTKLESLHIEVTAAHRQDWFDLTQNLVVHPKLTTLNLQHSVLDAYAYAVLTDLLKENYRIEMTLTPPTDRTLRKAYDTLQQRLAKPGFERFKEDHLSQTKLLQVAVAALESKDQTVAEQFNFLLTNSGYLAITDEEKEIWVKHSEVLPSIYKNHQTYLKHASSLVLLHVDRLVDGIKTAGYVLLEKALETDNLNALQTLLAVRANLFEVPADEQEPFLVKILQSKGELKRAVIGYIQQDQHLIKLAANYVASYPQLSHLVSEFKMHLDAYGTCLVKRDDRYHLIWISNEVLRIGRGLFGLPHPADHRGGEYAKIYLDLENSLQAMGQKLTYSALRQVQIIMRGIKANSIKASRGLMNRSSLHEKVIDLVCQFDEELELIKGRIYQEKDETIETITAERKRDQATFDKKYVEQQEEYEQKIAKMAAKQAELEDAMAAKQAELEDAMAAKQAELEDAMAAEQAELKAENAELRDEMAAKQAELKAENAELKAEMAAEQAKLKAENAELRAEMTAGQTEMKARQAEMEAMLIKMQSQMERLPSPTSTSQEERKGSSASRFFAQP